MFMSILPRALGPALAGTALLFLAIPATAPIGAASSLGGDWPSAVIANYKITFNGFELGNFRFQSQIGDATYALDGNAELSALLGAFSWQGITRSTGKVDGDVPRPGGYSFAYRSSSKTGSIVMGFDKTGVRDVKTVPPPEPAPEIIPVRAHHLKGTLDPLSAVMALTRSTGANPCDRRLAIFDGKQRFDLALSFRRQQRVVETKPSGQPDMGFVCAVRYIPIAGYKDNDETRSMSETASIEVLLRPVPSANLFVPHQISIPTIAGVAVLTADRVEIKTGKSGDIALVN